MSSDDDRKRKNYKLILDPVLEHGHSTKVYRFEGVIPGDPDPEPVVVSDPRSRIKRYWNKKDVLDIPVPRFKHDVYYVGTILPKEVSFSNLNDNINLDFLVNMCKGFGNIEDSRIYYHPRNKKHLGIGKVVFASTRSAKLCADKLNQTSRMGMLINAVVDPFGKERTKWIDMATGEKEKLHSSSPLQKSNPDVRSFQSKTTEATTTQKRNKEKHQQSRHISRDIEKESCNNSLKSDSKEYPPNNVQIHELHQANYVVSEHKFNNLETSQISDSEDFQSNTSSWSDARDSNLKGLRGTVKSDKSNQRRYERGSNYKQKYKDRHNKNNFDHREACNRLKHRPRRENRHSDSKEQVNSTDNRHTEIEKVTSDERVVLNYEDVPPETSEEKSADTNESEEPRMQSLESRIQSLLGGIGLSSPVAQEGQAAGDEETREEVKVHGHPPLPLGPTPLPPDDPPLPDEAAPPPLPPEPQPHYGYSGIGNRMEPKKAQLNIYLSNGHTLNTNKRNSGEEDDRMSLSSLGSEEETIEVNPPTLESGLRPPQPPLPPLPPMPWQLPPPVDPVHNQAFQNQVSNSVYSQGLLDSTFKTVSHSNNFGQEVEVMEEMFVKVLDQVINQLKFIMRKDLCKKMVQDTAFTTYDRWWTLEQQCDKFTKPSESLLAVESPAETSGTGLNTQVVFHSSTTLDTCKQPSTGMTGTIEALFDNKDGTGFGVGGLLGLPKGIPKMPSFRKKFLKPITPPPDDDDDDDDDGNDSDEHEFLGPRTPEESGAVVKSLGILEEVLINEYVM